MNMHPLPFNLLKLQLSTTIFPDIELVCIQSFSCPAIHIWSLTKLENLHFYNYNKT